jgi:type IV pilus assembly protein PilQ
MLPLSNYIIAQERFIEIEKKLNEISEKNIGLKENVELSVNGVTIQEFIRAISTAHKLNVSVDSKITGEVINNFSNANVSDVFLFLCRQYDLDIQFIGSIISFIKFIEPPILKEALKSKIPVVIYNSQNDFLSLELKNDSLDRVVQEITKMSLHNVILSPDVKSKLISVFIQNRPFESALDKMALANGLKVTKTSDNFYYLEKEDVNISSIPRLNSSDKKNTNNLGKNQNDNENDILIEIKDDHILSIETQEIPISSIIKAVSSKLYKNFFLYNDLKGNATLHIENVDYDQFLSYLLNGSDYTYKKQDDNVYLIGERSIEGLRTTELVQLQNRTVESILDAIPSELKKGVELKEFNELNGLILSGSFLKINEIKNFIWIIDQVVPMISIDVMILDVKKSSIVSTGISAGLGGGSSVQPISTGGTVFPDVNLSVTSTSINDLINGINGFGLINLGKVTPDFWLKIQALEEDGYLKSRSTPKLSTLNGHEANLKIGNTEYYLEEANNVIGSQNPQNIITRIYKSVNADLSVTIKPIVSGDDQVTLQIEVTQSDFTSRISADAPPGSVTRNFKSLIRVKNGELILLGGLEEKSKSDNTKGIPILARIPILKWFFTNKTREKNQSKLNIIIKPTIIY